MKYALGVPTSSGPKHHSGCRRSWQQDSQILERLAADEKSAQEIATALGRTRSSVNTYANRHSISIRSKNSPWGRLWTKREDAKLRKQKGKTVKQAVNVLPGRSYAAVFGRACSLGVELIPPDWSNHVKLTSRVRQVIAGVLLGDGSLTLTGSKKSASLGIEQHPSRLGWLRNVKQELAKSGVVSAIRLYMRRPKKLLEGRLLPGGRYWTLRSLSYAELVPERLRWYPRGIKRVPQDLRLSLRVVAHWLCGDGYDNHVGGIGFCTDGFTKDDVSLLVNKLQKDLGVHAHIKRTRPEQYHVVVGRLADAYKLGRGLKPLLPTCAQYKLARIRPFKGRWG